MGGGEQTHVLCGEYSGKADICPTREEGHLHDRFRYNCKKVSCPACYEKRISKQAHFALERFQDVFKAYYLQGHELSFGELILSPPVDLYGQLEDEKQLAALRKTVMEYAQDCGVIGGMTIVHPYRGRKKHMDAIRSKKIQGKKSYHFHIVGARLSTWEKSNEFYKRTGWVYKWVDETIQNGKHKGEKRNMYEKIRYELDHAGLPEIYGKYGQIATWWGIFSRNAIAQIKTVTHEPRLCPVCKIQAHRFELDESIDVGPAEATVTKYDHHMRPGAIDRARDRFKIEPGQERYETLKEVTLSAKNALSAEETL